MTALRARLAASRPGMSAYLETLARIPPDLVGSPARVAAVTIYPIKALGGIELSRARMDRGGLTDPSTGFADRSAMFAFTRPGTTPDGEAFTARALSNRLDGTLSLARARLDGRAIVYEAPGVEPLRVRPEDLAARDGPVTRVHLYEGGPIVEGVALEGPLTDWIRALLRAHPRRRRFEPEDAFAVVPARASRRDVAAKHRAGQDAATIYGDGGHVLIASSSTLAWMNDVLRARGERQVDMAAFRPNLILDGLAPNAEDIIEEAHVEGSDGPVPFLFATMCVRCDATRIDVRTGERAGKQPLAFLAKERPPRDDDPTSATFAVNAVVPASAHGRSFAVGASLRVERERR